MKAEDCPQAINEFRFYNLSEKISILKKAEHRKRMEGRKKPKTQLGGEIRGKTTNRTSTNCS